jgi:hypothetical protein
MGGYALQTLLKRGYWLKFFAHKKDPKRAELKEKPFLYYCFKDEVKK